MSAGTPDTGAYRVFISHGSADRWIAKRIRSELQSSGTSCFLDDADIQVGDDFRTTILCEVEKCHELLVLLTPTSLNRAWIFAEVGAAVARGKRIVAIRYGVDLQELHGRGIVSLVGDTQIISLDDMDHYVAAVVERGRRDHA